jgi:superfamily I DNA and RNA helicase
MSESLEKRVLGITITDYFNTLGKRLNQRFSIAAKELANELKQTNIYDENMIDEVYFPKEKFLF